MLVVDIQNGMPLNHIDKDYLCVACSTLETTRCGHYRIFACLVT